MKQEDIKLTAGQESLAGRLIKPDRVAPAAHVVFLHGAGKATKERAQPIAEHLAEHYGIASLLFDFSGHGASSGRLEDSSLAKRVDEALEVIRSTGLPSPISVCAFSMGGHVALELLRHVPIRGLFLFYPAVYATQAQHIRFGDPLFTQILRRERSWETSETFEILETFSGRLLVVIGELDEVIPKDVISRIIETATLATEKTLITVENAPHLLLPVLVERPTMFDDVCETIAKYAITTVAHQADNGSLSNT